MNFLRLGFDGYRRVQGYAREVATRLSERVAELGPFKLITSGNELPVFAFTLADDVTNYSVFDVSRSLRERGWLLPASNDRRRRFTTPLPRHSITSTLRLTSESRQSGYSRMSRATASRSRST